jgi:serine/threonine protein kinase
LKPVFYGRALELRPRAVGKRIGFAEVSPAVRASLVDRYGPLEVVTEHVGGMSPGCATTLEAPGGARLFVKAVGAELNPDRPTLFRGEISVLSQLPPAPYRPELLGSFDDGRWVAVVLEDVPGRMPDLADQDEFRTVASVVCQQAAEPTWALRRFGELHASVRSLSGRLDGATLCHFDLRDDNLLIRTDGQVFVLDWGMARVGPAWLDKAFFALQAATPELADECLHKWIAADDQDVVTNLVVAFAGSQAWNSTRPPPPGLPTLPEFCRNDAARVFDVARLRL